VMMPEMTGADFHRELSRVSPNLSARVIFMTGGAFTPEARKFLEGAANEIVYKPFDRAILLEAIEKLQATCAASARPNRPGLTQLKTA
jgi:FixJ family two-component response regulator